MIKKLLALFYAVVFFHSSVFAVSKIIIDTDPGIDDSLAILLAFQSHELEVIGLTSTFGNGDIDLTTKNCHILCELAGKNIPVAKGSRQPLIISKRPNPDFVHGIDGLGNIHWQNPVIPEVHETAEDFIIRNIVAHPKEITLVALGPLTNLAKALLKEPMIAEYVKEVVVFAGVFFIPGNVSPIAEANVWGDPHAADIVFSAHWKLTTLCLNTSQKPQLTKEILNRIEKKNPRIGTFLNRSNQFYIDFYLSQDPTLQGANVHDALNICYLLNQGLFTKVQGSICVALEGVAEGAAILDTSGSAYYEPWFNRPKLNVCLDCDGEKVMTLIEEKLSQP